MSRRVHLVVITCAATEADTEGDSEIACGTQAEFDAKHLTNYQDHVTCKRCLKRIQVESHQA